MNRFRVLFLAMLVGVPGLLLAQPYVINNFKTSMDLHADGSMDVEEHIFVTFNETRHGIFRFIPVDYETQKGVARHLDFSSISVTDGTGAGQTTQITREGANVKIRIGDKDVMLPNGTQKEYVIRYSVFGMINWFSKSEDWVSSCELYWNVTGDQWDTTIEESSAIVHFPNTSDTAALRARVFVGALGSTLGQTLEGPHGATSDEASQTVLSLSSNTLSVERKAPLEAGEGMTVVLSMPEDLIKKPTFAQSAMRFLRSNLGFAIPILVLLAMPVLFLIYGRDPGGGPVVVQFEPPDGISASEAGTLTDESVDQRDIAAGIIALAVKGYVTIYPTESGLLFKHRGAELEVTDKPASPDLSLFEAKLLDRLQGIGGRITETDLRTSVAPHLSEFQSLLYDNMVDRGYYRKAPQNVRAAWGCAGTVGVIVLGIICTIINPFHYPLPAIIGGIVAVIIIGIFARGMPKRTADGSVARQRVIGFEEFIRRARGQELEWQSKKHPDQALFEEYLPYAVAFGLTAEWAQAFEGIVKQMPSWYAAPPGTPFSPIWFASDLGMVNNSLASAATTPPRSSGASGGSSGFSGGGFSGGGFGGGGGGSW